MTWVLLDSPIGALGVAVDDAAVYGVSFGGVPKHANVAPPSSARVEMAAREQLTAYFAGELTDFDLPLEIRRGSEFEREVWREIAAIPYGETASYGAIAKAVGEPGGAQAVGTACNRNPLPVVIACHRVIGSDGKLVGFGGGLDLKRWLLQLEAKVHLERTWAP